MLGWSVLKVGGIFASKIPAKWTHLKPALLEVQLLQTGPLLKPPAVSGAVGCLRLNVGSASKRHSHIKVTPHFHTIKLLRG